MTSNATLLKEVPIPDSFLSPDLTRSGDAAFGGDVRVGDLTGDGRLDFVVFQSLGGLKPTFIGAFTVDGDPLWTYGDKQHRARNTEDDGWLETTAPMRPGPVAIYDIDQDGHQEVICLALAPEVEATTQWTMDGMEIVVLDGHTGCVKHRAAPEELARCGGYVDGELHAPNYVHHRLLIANLRGRSEPQDFVVKLGNGILAFDDGLGLLWRYENQFYAYGQHSAYIPNVGDIDGDGCDEVTGGHYCLDQDGRVIWEKCLSKHMDSVLIDEWQGKRCAILSGYGQVLDERGNVLLRLGPDVVPHGQELRYGELLPEHEGRELVIRYDGHTPRLMVVTSGGEVVTRFDVEPSPNNTGLEIIHWHGPQRPSLIYSPAVLYDGYGRKVVTFPELPPPSESKLGNQGWYHCIPVNVCGNEAEQVILYDMYADRIFIYGAADAPTEDVLRSYRHTARQYNVRLMD